MSIRRLLAGSSAALLAGSLAFALPASASPARGPHQAITIHGAAGRVVNPRTAEPVATHTYTHTPLRQDGTYARSDLSRAVSGGRKPATGGVVSPFTQVTSSNFDALTQTSAGCTCAATPQANSAVGPNNIVEVLADEMSVYSKSGTPQFSVRLSTLLGTANALAFPRIIYDPLWNRWVMAVQGLPPTTSDYGQIWTLVSTTADPTGTWYVFHQNIFWAGLNGVADFPVIGMDRDSLIVSSNNFTYDTGTQAYLYGSTTAYAIPKAIIYNSSNEWSSSVFFMAFGTVPAIVTGNPIPDATKIFLIGTDVTNQTLHIYSLANSSHFGRQVFHQLADATYSHVAPSRRVHQPGTAVTLDAADGRITAPPSQDGKRVWFAAGVDFLGFPGVEWGYVTTGASPVTHLVSASRSGSSDDFNPSLAAVTVGGVHKVILTWAFTDTFNNVPVRDVWDSQVGLALATKSGTTYSLAGGSTTTNDMSVVSSVALDYSPPCGTSAVVTDEYFAASGRWRTRIAEVGVC